MFRTMIPFAAAIAMLAATTTQAAAAPCFAPALAHAAKYQQLDIMLMVNSLRCRTSAHDFRAEYDSFRANHRAEMGAKIALVLTAFGQHGTAAQARADLEQARTIMANLAAQPTTMSCANLRELTTTLAAATEDKVAFAADALVVGTLAVAVCPVQLAKAEVTARK